MNVIDSHVYLGEGIHLAQDEDTLLKRMDEAGVTLAIACPVDRYLAVYNRDGNDTILAAVKRHPDRLMGMASVNPWYVSDAAIELRRALDAGLHGLFFNPNYQGFRLSDHIVDPLIGVAADYGVPVYAHSGTAGIAEPFHVVELARRFPGVNFIMGHAGSSDYGEDAVRALEFADNLWLETSRNGPANFGLWQVRNCWSKAVFGSSAPEYIPEIEIETLCDVFTAPEEREAILGGNIRDVFGGKIDV